MLTFNEYLTESKEPLLPWEKAPKLGWWKDGTHVTVYHGTHDRNISDIKKNGITHKDAKTGHISVAHDPYTAHGYASMSGAGGERNFRTGGTTAVHTPQEHRTVVKMRIPHKWVHKHMDHELGGNEDRRPRLQNKEQYDNWKSKGKSDHEYYEKTELRLNHAIPTKFIVGYMKKTKTT